MKEEKHDFVKTPKELTEALLRYEDFEGEILEPCCNVFMYLIKK